MWTNVRLFVTTSHSGIDLTKMEPLVERNNEQKYDKTSVTIVNFELFLLLKNYLFL